VSARYPPVSVKVWGEYACFTRPEMKVERVSYAVPTASAARGILEAIFWKPEFTWQVEEVWVLRPIRYCSILRNEVNHRASERTARRWAAEGGGYDATADRSQRHTLALREVAYVIRAGVRVGAGVDQDPAKFRDQFRRRVERGQCYARPYLGCREFSALFGEPDDADVPLDVTMDLGRMLLDLDYAADGSGRGTPAFHDARLERGIVRYPARAPGEVEPCSSSV